MEQFITIRSNKEEINEIKIDKEMPTTNIRIIISREDANKLSNWNEVKKGSIDSELVGTFNPNTNEPVESIEIEETPVNEEIPAVESTPVIAEEIPEFKFPTPEETPVVTESNDFVDENVVSEPDNSAELMFKDNEPVDEVPVNNMVSSEPSETLTELSNQQSNIVDTSVEEPVNKDKNNEWSFDSEDQTVYDSSDDKPVYDPDEELIEQEKHLMK